MGKKIKCVSLLLFFMMVTILNWSCEKGEGYGDSFFSKSFITDYCIPDTLVCEEVWGYNDSVFVKFRFRGSYCSSTSGSHLNNGEEEGLLFDSLMRRYADTTYNREVYIEGNKALANPIDSISIISDADFDERHAAGKDLSDIVKFYGKVYGSYVFHGYFEDEKYVEYYDEGNFYINKRLSDFRSEEYCLWGHTPFRLDFPKPTLAQLHHVTFTFVTGGKRFEATAELNFND